MKLILTIIFIILIQNIVTAITTCEPNNIDITITQGQQINQQIIICTNGANQTVKINKIGNFFSTNPQLPIILSPLSANKQININFNQINTPGTYIGYIYFSDNSTPIQIKLNIKEQINGCNIDIFPTLLSNVKIQQGQIKTRNILVTVPSCYKDYIDFRAVALQSDEKPIQLGELSLGRIQPGNSIQIPIIFDAEEVSTGTYQDTLEFNLANSSGIRLNVPSVSITAIVTSGVQPITNLSLSDLPSCSLSSIEMNLNSTYRLVCTITNPNIEIEPDIDTNIIQGTNVIIQGNQYIYEFKPKKIGTTIIRAYFKYKNAKIGEPFEQDVRITYSGSTPISGTTMKFEFYQDGIKKSKDNLLSGEVIVLVLDNKTNSVIPSFDLYLNGIKTNNTINLEANKNYILRASSIGYLDLVENFTIKPRNIKIYINPSKTFYFVGDKINITTDVNATILIDNTIIENNYTFQNPGNYTIIAKKEGYKDTNLTIIVKEELRLISYPPQELIGYGKELFFEFNKKTNWKVSFIKEGSQIPEIIKNGSSKSLSINIDRRGGTYFLESNGKTFWSVTIERGGWWRWWYIFIIAGLILIIYITYIGRKKEKSEEKLVFSPSTSSEGEE